MLGFLDDVFNAVSFNYLISLALKLHLKHVFLST